MANVFLGRSSQVDRVMVPVERGIYVLGSIRQSSMTGWQYARGVLFSNLVIGIFVYFIFMAQGVAKHNYCSIHERILVCISTCSTSLQLLRCGARIANHMNGRLYGLFVENPDRFLTKQESFAIETSEKLCQEFEGEFLRIKSHNIVDTITQVARENRITQIVVGETRRSRWELLIRGSMVQKLMRTLPDIDLHIIATKKSE